MTVQDTIHNVAATVTYSSAASATALWGLHLSDLGVIVSASAAVCGVFIQWLIYRRTRPADIHLPRDVPMEGPSTHDRINGEL